MGVDAAGEAPRRYERMIAHRAVGYKAPFPSASPELSLDAGERLPPSLDPHERIAKVTLQRSSKPFPHNQRTPATYPLERVARSCKTVAMANDADLRVATVAARQHGVFTTDDAKRAGASSALITRRLDAGRWMRLAPGVYSIAGTALTWERSVSTAVLRVGGLVAASHRTAAHIHGLYGRPRRIEVVTTVTGKRNLPFIVHQCQDLVEAEIVSVDGLAVTDVARTVVDIGVPAGIAVAQRVLDTAVRNQVTTLEEVAGRIHRYGRRGRRGIGPARRLVIERLGWDEVTDSVLEDAFLRLAERSGLPRPTPQHRVVMRQGRRVVRLDFDFGARVVVELDSEKFHTDRDSFRNDRRRQNDLVQAGYVVLRFTWWDVMAAPEYVAATVSTALRQNGAA